MVDISAIAGVVSALKGAKDITKSLIGLRDSEMIRAKVGELNEIIIDAQERVFAVNEERSTLMDRVGLLEGEVARFEDWDSEKQRYQLTDFGSGTFAYSLKTD